MTDQGGTALAPALEMRGITKRYPGVVANDRIDLEVRPGEIHALLGENGAGKTTLMNVLYGLATPDEGEILLDGQQVRIASPADAIARGIDMVHQHFMLVPVLTVAENILLGEETMANPVFLDRKEAHRRIVELGRQFGFEIDPEARVGSLSVGWQQRVEILKALYHGARVLILDEPTAVLTPQEVDDLFRVLRDLQAQGTTIVLITHKLAEVTALAQRVTVMRAGRVVGGGPVGEFPVERLAELMVGHPIPPLHARAPREAAPPQLEVRLLDVLDDRGLQAVRRVSFAVHAGEIVGVAGVEGNGQHELVECLAGLRRAQHGEICITGRDCTALSARERTAAGLAHIPSDRLRRGLVPEMTLAENLVLGRQREPGSGRGPLLPRRTLEARAAGVLAAYDVRPAEPGRPARQLSGGNQQKLIAARELSRGAPVVLAAHPTRGVDLGAVAFLHRRLLRERDAGRAVLLVSAELSEVLALADRIFVMYEGRLVHETRPAETDERTLGLYMTGRRGAAAP